MATIEQFEHSLAFISAGTVTKGICGKHDISFVVRCPDRPTLVVETTKGTIRAAHQAGLPLAASLLTEADGFDEWCDASEKAV